MVIDFFRKGGVEKLAHVAAVFLAAFGLYEYFDQKRGEENRLLAKEALAYIQYFNDPPLSEHVDELRKFWLENFEFSNAVGGGQLTEMGYQIILERKISQYRDRKKLLYSLLEIDEYYRRLQFCLDNKLCETSIIHEYFCERASRHARLFGNVSRRIGAEFGDDAVGKSALQFATSC